METSGYVLVCESFEFEHDYKVIAFSKDSKPLNDYKDALESVGSRGQKGLSTFKRSYYVFAVENH